MLPEAFHGGTQLLARMADATFTPDEVVALMASHSTGRQVRLTSVLLSSYLTLIALPYYRTIKT